MHLYGYRHAKTAGRNVAFKVEVARMREYIMKDQDELITRKSDCDDVALEAHHKATLEDVHRIHRRLNQEDNTQS